jgi:hypothetical protein
VVIPMSFLSSQVKHVVPFWYIVEAKGRKPEIFHPDEEDAAIAYFDKCHCSHLDPQMRREYTQ